MANHRLTKKEIYRRFQEKHGNKYSYADFEYEGINMRIDIFCPEHGWFNQKISDHIRGSGCNLCGNESQRRAVYKSIIRGCCIYDIDDVGSLTPLIRKAKNLWRAMIRRCYDPKLKKINPTYIGCEICDEWKRLSGFVKWFKNNYIGGYELDKDILVKGNKIYSPDTCCFIPHEINTLVNRCNGLRGDFPLGVHKHRNKYIASMRKKMRDIRIGSFSTPEAAFYAYKEAKEAYIKEVAQEYYDKGLITWKVYNALMNWKIEITD